MGCTPSSRRNRLWNNTIRNAVLPIPHYPMVGDTWAGQHFYADSYNLPQHLESLGEPPPYTELPENGHISLMRSPSFKEEDPVADPTGYSSMNESTVTNQLNSSVIATLEAEQELGISQSSMDELHTLRPVGTSSPLQANPVLRPVRSSSPVPTNTAFFPERPRSRSVDNTSTGPVFPPRTVSEHDMNYSARRILLPAPFSPPQFGNNPLAFPNRLPPLQQQLSEPHDRSCLSQSMDERALQHLPVGMDGNQLPPLQHQLLQMDNELSGEMESQVAFLHQFSQSDCRTNAHSTEGQLPALQHQLSQPDNRLLLQSEGQHRRRRRRSRKRGHTWHGERVAPAPEQQQDAQPIIECT